MQTSVYTVWQQFARLVKQVLPGLHGHRCKTLGWLVVGIMLAKSVASAQMAEVLRRIRGTQASSQERTISRFLANEAIDAQALWRSFLPVLLAGWANQAEVTFVVDTTPLGNWAIIVSFGILSHSRVWPLGWRVMPAEQSWDEGQYDLIAQFMAAVRPHLGQTQCRLLADSGIAARSWCSCVRMRAGITSCASNWTKAFMPPSWMRRVSPCGNRSRQS